MSEHRREAAERSASASGAARVEVTQVKSTIGTKPVHRATIKALGLGGIGRVTTLPDSADVRGMLHKVTHLLSVRAAPQPTDARPAAADTAPALATTEEPA